MKIRIAALVLLGIALIGATLGAVIVGNSASVTAPDPVSPTIPFSEDVVKTTCGEDSADPSAERTQTQGHVSVLAAGDNLVLDRIRRDANIIAGGTGDPSQFSKTGFAYAPMYEALRPLLNASDVAVLNQDSLVWDDTASGGMRSLLGDQLVGLGFNVVSIANNSMLSEGEQALLDSVSYWRRRNVALLGGNLLPDEKDSIVVVEKNGVRIAFLSYTYGVDGELSENSQITLPLIDKEKMTRDVIAAKEQTDLVVAYLHWGEVNQTDRGSSQSEIAQHLVDLGVDVIIGSHPNVIQEMKWKTRADGSETLICYSLGNLISAMEYNKNLLGGVVTFDVDKDAEGRCTVSNVKFVPVFTHYDRHFEQISVRLLDTYDQSQLDDHGSSILKGAGSYDYFIQLIRQYIPSEFLDQFYVNYVFRPTG